MNRGATWEAASPPPGRIVLLLLRRARRGGSAHPKATVCGGRSTGGEETRRGTPEPVRAGAFSQPRGYEMRLAEALERLAQQCFGIEPNVAVARACVEGPTGFAGLEAEPAQAVEDLLADVCPWG